MTDKQIIDKLKNDVTCKENIINHLAEHNIKLQDQLARKEQELGKICKAFDIEYAIDEETGNLFGRCNKLYKKEQERKELVSKCNQLDKKCKQQSWDIGNLGYKIKNQRHEINNRLKQLDQLKAENEKIEQCIIEQNRLVVGMTKEIETLTFKKYELLQTLAEIKEIANYSFNLSTSELMAKLEQILQKISECEATNDR